jgi:POT family proton-dependent oligopeptide transporter
MSHEYRETPEETTKMPSGIPFIVGNEAAERFSYYGMNSILMVFMMNYLVTAAGAPDHMSEEEASSWIHDFKAANYAFPILGAIFADCFTGKYRMIIWLSLVYCLGHTVLAFMDAPTGVSPRLILASGLGLIALGAGGIKSCVSAHVGDQFGDLNKNLLERVYSWFYFSINFGAGFSQMICPFLLRSYGPGIAFGVPGTLMGLATLVFWFGRYRYAHIPASPQRFRDSLTRENLMCVARLSPIFLFIAVFWALFDQSATRWVAQAERMNRHIFGFEIEAASTQSVNAICVLLFIPLFTYVVYPTINKFVRLTPLRKIGLGLFTMVPVFLVSGYIETQVDSGASPHISWQILAYAVLTCSEIMVSITALEFSYTQGPPTMKSIMMGINMLSVTLGNFFVARINKWIDINQKAGTPVLDGATYYWFFAGCMAVAAVAFVPWSMTYRGREQLQTEAPPAEDESPAV